MLSSSGRWTVRTYLPVAGDTFQGRVLLATNASQVIAPQDPCVEKPFLQRGLPPLDPQVRVPGSPPALATIPRPSSGLRAEADHPGALAHNGPTYSPGAIPTEMVVYTTDA